MFEIAILVGSMSPFVQCIPADAGLSSEARVGRQVVRAHPGDDEFVSTPGLLLPSNLSVRLNVEVFEDLVREYQIVKSWMASRVLGIGHDAIVSCSEHLPKGEVHANKYARSVATTG